MVIICANSVKSWPKEKLGKVKVGLNIAQNRCLADRKSHEVIICPSSCQKFTKSEIGSSWKLLFTQIHMGGIYHYIKFEREPNRGGGGKGSFNNQTGPFWFTSILSFILIYMSNIEALSWYDKNILIFKIKNIFYFFRGHVGPLHKIQGYRGHRNVIKCSPHHNGDNVQQGETIWKPVFHIWAKM